MESNNRHQRSTPSVGENEADTPQRGIAAVAASGAAAAHSKQRAGAFAFGIAVIEQGIALAADEPLGTTRAEVAQQVADRVGLQAYLKPQARRGVRIVGAVGAPTVDVFIDVRVQVQVAHTIFVNVWDLIVVSIFNSDVAAAAEAAAAEAAAAEAAAAEVAAADVVDVVDLLIL